MYCLHTHTHTLEPSQQSSVRFGSFEAKQKCGNVTALGDRLLAPWHPYYSPAPPPPPPHPILPLLSSPLLHSPRQTHPPTTDTTFVTRTHADCHGISGSKLLLGLDVFNISISNNVSSLSAQRRGGAARIYSASWYSWFNVFNRHYIPRKSSCHATVGSLV